MYAQTVCDGRIEVEGFTCGAFAVVDRHDTEGAHVVQAIRKLDQDDSEILGHRHGHFLEVLGLCLVVGVGDVFELGHAVDDLGNIGAKSFAQGLLVDTRVLQNVVQDRGDDGFLVHMHVGQDVRDGQRMRDEGVTGLADLSLVRLACKMIGALHAAYLPLRQIGGKNLRERI